MSTKVVRNLAYARGPPGSMQTLSVTRARHCQRDRPMPPHGTESRPHLCADRSGGVPRHAHGLAFDGGACEKVVEPFIPTQNHRGSAAKLVREGLSLERCHSHLRLRSDMPYFLYQNLAECQGSRHFSISIKAECAIIKAIHLRRGDENREAHYQGAQTRSGC